VPLDSLYLTTAIEAVVLAGDLQMERFGGEFRIDKKGTIDLVTEVDVAIERRFRALIAERFPDHQILAEELGGAAAVPSGPCWVFDPIDGTSNFAHGLPIFCASLALEIDGVAQVGAVYDPNRKELFTAERGGGAFVNGRPLHVSSAASRRSSACSARSSARRAPCGGSGPRRSISATSRRAGSTVSGRRT
jgi:myo-inositol-1(or 4)-monophosphatase